MLNLGLNNPSTTRLQLLPPVKPPSTVLTTKPRTQRVPPEPMASLPAVKVSIPLLFKNKLFENETVPGLLMVRLFKIFVEPLPDWSKLSVGVPVTIILALVLPLIPSVTVLVTVPFRVRTALVPSTSLLDAIVRLPDTVIEPLRLTQYPLAVATVRLLTVLLKKVFARTDWLEFDL